MKKMIIIMLFLFILFMGIMFFLLKKNNISKIDNIEETTTEIAETTEETTFLLYKPHLYVNGDQQAILVIIGNDKREEWDRISLSDGFKRKYANKPVAMPEGKYYWNDIDRNLIYNFSEEEQMSTILEETSDSIYAVSFEIISNDNYEIEDIILKKRVKVYDLINDDYTDKIYITEENYSSVLECILCPSYEFASYIDIPYSRRNVALSDNFFKKYGYDKDCIEHENPISFISCLSDSFADRTAILYCEYNMLDIEVKYKVKFKLNLNGELDNIEIDNKETSNKS